MIDRGVVLFRHGDDPDDAQHCWFMDFLDTFFGAVLDRTLD